MSRYSIGDRVSVLDMHPPGHVRTPSFIRGMSGIIETIEGPYLNPEELAYGRSGIPEKTLYRVRFQQIDLWPDFIGNPRDTAIVDIYEHWLDA